MIINTNEIQAYTEYIQMQKDLQIRLLKIQEHQELILKEINTIKSIAKIIKQIKQRNKFHANKELNRIIQKYAKEV